MPRTYRVILPAAVLVMTCFAVTAQAWSGQLGAGPRKAKAGEDRSRGSRGGGGRSERGGPPPLFFTDVPAHLVDVILARPTDRAVTLSILAYQDMEGEIEYGSQSGRYDHHTGLEHFKKGQPLELVLGGLEPNTEYRYRLRYRAAGSTTPFAGLEGCFHTARPPGSRFVFTIQADSHLDGPTSTELYARTLKNVLAEKPDFHIDLGDTFMTDKYDRYPGAEAQYLAQRYYFGLLCHSAPLFLVLGNHDGEAGWWLDGTSENVGVWSNTMRKRYFPNPVPDRFYSGNRTRVRPLGLLENYYAWEWGGVLFVVLDPFWHTLSKARHQGEDYWNRTLGRQQYEWLASTLEESRAGLKFVFIHHLVGGIDANGRGGAEAAPYFEWGGRSMDDRDEFHDKRPGWGSPIHQLLVRNGVDAVFHGHDHVFVKQDLDGIVYQLLPQPGHARYGNVRTAGLYGYTHGDVVAGSGHLRVTVSGARATVDFIVSYLPNDETPERRNGKVAYSYTVGDSASACTGDAADLSRPPTN